MHKGAGRPRGTSPDQRRHDALMHALFAVAPHLTRSMCSRLATGLADERAPLGRSDSGRLRFAMDEPSSATGYDRFLEQSRKTARRFSRTGPYKGLCHGPSELAEVAEDTGLLIVIFRARYLDTIELAANLLAARGWPNWMLGKIATLAVDGRSVTRTFNENARRSDERRCFAAARRPFGVN